MHHLDLFSGIGGFALATEMVWGRDNVSHTFCDIEPFSQAVLRKHWPDSMIYGDIRSLTADAEKQRIRSMANRTQGKAHSHFDGKNKREVDLLTGGFPCQPFSTAGKRRGTEDSRHLWPEMLRVIQEFHPRWIIGENVGGLVTWNGGLVLEQVHTDLESAGYEVQAFIIPACALDAPHRRDRIWIVAHQDDNIIRHQPESERWGGDSPVPRIIDKNTSDTGRGRRPGRKETQTGYILSDGQDAGRRKNSSESARPITDARHAARTRRQRGQQGQHTQLSKRIPRRPDTGNAEWSQSWPQVAARLCTLDDGLPGGLARPRGWRNAALKGAGNAIVPQIAAQIMRAIKKIDES